jgi:hypothetical protein
MGGGLIREGSGWGEGGEWDGRSSRGELMGLWKCRTNPARR